MHNITDTSGNTTWSAMRVRDTGDVIIRHKVALVPGHGITHEVVISAEEWITLVAEMAAPRDQDRKVSLRSLVRQVHMGPSPGWTESLPPVE
jgi:hypothetical protein